jgi:MFS family permease
MWVSRIIAGIGIGISTTAVPILQAETLPPRNRGALLVIQSGLINTGVAFPSWLSYSTLCINNPAQWRIPIAMQLLFSGLVLFACLFIPETPRWLCESRPA